MILIMFGEISLYIPIIKKQQQQPNLVLKQKRKIIRRGVEKSCYRVTSTCSIDVM